MTMLLTERWPQIPERANYGERATPAGRSAGRRETGPGPGGSTHGGQQESAHELLAEMAALIRDTRVSLTVSGAVAGAVLLGLATESVVLPVTGRGAGTVAAFALFAMVAVCLLRTLTLIVLAGLPLGQTLSQQRVTSGAPLDPRAPWASIPGPDADPRPWAWARAHLLLSQARFRADRIQAATTWALITAAAFLLCTAVVLLAR